MVFCIIRGVFDMVNRLRDVQLALKTTAETKENLSYLADLLSAKSGFRMTQTQVVEKLIADELTRQAGYTKQSLVRYRADHGSSLAHVSGLPEAMMLRMQENANALACAAGCDIKIVYGLNGLDKSGSTAWLFDVMNALTVTPTSELKFHNPAMERRFAEYRNGVGEHFGMKTLMDHPFFVMRQEDNAVIALGTAPYLAHAYDGVVNRMVSNMTTMLDMLMGMLSDSEVMPDELNRVGVHMFGPRESIYVPEIAGDTHPHACTALIFLKNMFNGMDA